MKMTMKIEECLQTLDVVSSGITCLGGEMAGPVDDCGGAHERGFNFGEICHV